MEKINHNSLCETETHKVGMTDNEIIKALKCCINNDALCSKCPYKEIECINSSGDNLMLKNVIDLINRQKAEKQAMLDHIKVLQYENEKLNEQINQKNALNEILKMDLGSVLGERNALEEMVAEQKAEVEMLKEENKKQKAILEEINDEINPLPFETDFDIAMEKAKFEAIKEFMERIEKECNRVNKGYRIGFRTIDVRRIAKEMTEQRGDSK